MILWVSNLGCVVLLLISAGLTHVSKVQFWLARLGSFASGKMWVTETYAFHHQAG